MRNLKKEVPKKYKSTFTKLDIMYIKVQCTSAIGATVKEEVPKHYGEDSMEYYLMCTRTLDTIVKRYNWWSIPVNITKVELVFETMSRMLSD
eukprot:15340629-Ditylum_brightwellii.AAC.1